MANKSGGEQYESLKSLNQQLTLEATDAYFGKKSIPFGDAQKKALNLVGDDGKFTNLALLLSEQCRHVIKLGVFEGNAISVLKDRYEFTGSVLKQLEDIFSFIDRFNGTRAEYRGLDRIDKRDYPVEAIRESLLNAIVHRAYELVPSSLISVFDDRLEFITIGGLMKGISMNDIMLGVSALRNPRLAEVFYRLNLIEAHGMGMQKIYDSYSEFAIKPKTVYSDNAFKITLPNTNHHSSETTKIDLGEREKKVISLAKKQKRITRKDIEEVLEISQATAIILLREMTEKGLLSKTGQGKNIRYECHAAIE